MEGKMRILCVLGLVTVLSIITNNNVVNGAGECGKRSPDMEALSLMPCAEAARDENASVSGRCCAQIKRMGQNPDCLCAVLMSRTAKSSGVNPEVALSIPKRCNFDKRPIGYKCGPYTLP